MFLLSKRCLSQMHSLCCVSKDADLGFLSAGLLCVWLQVCGWMMKDCTSARPKTSLEPSKLRPELVSLDWVGLPELSYLCTTKYFRNNGSNSKADCGLEILSHLFMSLHFLFLQSPLSWPKVPQSSPLAWVSPWVFLACCWMEYLFQKGTGPKMENL